MNNGDTRKKIYKILVGIVFARLQEYIFLAWSFSFT